MAQEPIRLVADKRLEKDLQAAQTPDEIRDLLHASIARSPQLGIERDAQTGQFISSRRDPLTPAAQDAADDANTVTKSVDIGGHSFEFSGTEEQVERDIAQARQVAAAVTPVEQQVTPRSARKAEADAGLEAVRQAELSLAFKRGELSTADYLRESGALAQALRESGVDVEKIAGEQYSQSWQQATEEFLHSDAGRDWPGGPRNLEAIGLRVQAMGLADEPSVESLTKAWQAMKESGAVFNDTSDEQVLAETANMSPTEIIERWKEAHVGQDATAANQEFISAFRGGRIGGSGIFNL